MSVEDDDELDYHGVGSVEWGSILELLLLFESVIWIFNVFEKILAKTFEFIFLYSRNLRGEVCSPVWCIITVISIELWMWILYSWLNLTKSIVFLNFRWIENSRDSKVLRIPNWESRRGWEINFTLWEFEVEIAFWRL